MGRIARAVAIVSALLWMAACQAAIQQQQEKKAQIHYYNATVDRDRILISTGDLSNPHEKLGDLSYTEATHRGQHRQHPYQRQAAPDGDRQMGHAGRRTN